MARYKKTGFMDDDAGSVSSIQLNEGVRSGGTHIRYHMVSLLFNKGCFGASVVQWLERSWSESRGFDSRFGLDIAGLNQPYCPIRDDYGHDKSVPATVFNGARYMSHVRCIWWLKMSDTRVTHMAT